MLRRRRPQTVTGPRLLAAALVIGTAVAGCSTATATRSGADAPPLELVLANADGNLDGAPAVSRFIDRLQELADGRIRVRVESQWAGGADEARVLHDVAGGRADLGWSGTRALDLVGVDAFTPLHVPFLVNSFEAERAVVADPEITGLLGQLDGAGLVGLALLADELRFPVGTDGPLLVPADYAGARISSYPSGVQSTALEALGAVPTDEFVREGMDPPVDGFETMWWTYQERELWQVGRYVTANTPLWPRTAVLVADPATMADLDDQQMGWVQEAAADAAAWSLGHADDRVAGYLETACDAGARIALADDGQRAALRDGAAPVYDRMRSDEGLAPTLARVEELVASAGEPVGPEIPEGCRYQEGDVEESGAPDPLAGPGDSGDFPQGSYRTTVSEQLLRDAGASAEDIRNNAGVYTWTLDGGRWSYSQVPDDPTVTTTDCEGYYDVDGQQVTFTTVTQVARGTCAPPTWVAVYEPSDDGVVWTDAAIDGHPDAGYATGFNGDGWTFVS